MPEKKKWVLGIEPKYDPLTDITFPYRTQNIYPTIQGKGFPCHVVEEAQATHGYRDAYDTSRS